MSRGPFGPDDSARGSALVMAIFVLVLLTSLGIALLGLSQLESRMVQADNRSKFVFYLAEAGLEDGRGTLLAENSGSVQPGQLDDELAAHAGPDGEIDFDPATLKPVYDASGKVTGFAGYDDDVPLRGLTSFEGGFYGAFLTNDPIDDAVDPVDDTNNRVIITAIGTGPGFAVEIVQALVERTTLPSLPATITILGSDPTFEGGTSPAKLLTGDDCNGAGVPGLHVPVVGVIGSAAEVSAEEGVDSPATYESGESTGVDTIGDIEAMIHPLLNNCAFLLDLASRVRDLADVVGDSATPSGDLGTAADPKTVYIEGDYAIHNVASGGGLLWVTGELTSQGNVAWEGAIFVVGTGEYRRTGAGNAAYSGGFLVANVAGPDGTMWTSDDCAGPDGVPLTTDDDFEPGSWDVQGGGAGETVYCTEAFDRATQFPLRVDQFRQR